MNSPELEKREPTVEELIKATEEGILSHLKERRSLIDESFWRTLIPQITHADLKNSETAKAYNLTGENRIYAHAHGNGEIEVDTEMFGSFNELQRQYTLTHEASHRLGFLLRTSGDERYASLFKRLGSLPSHEASRYVALLDQKIPDSEKNKQKMLDKEKEAEILAQYLNSDGTFRGFMAAKTLQFEGNSTVEPYWARYKESFELMEEMGGVEDMDDEARAQFFADNPQLEPHYQMFQELGSILNDAELMESLEELEYDDEDEEEWLEYPMMVENMPAQQPIVPKTRPTEALPSQAALQAQSHQGVGEFLDLFWFCRRA